LRKLLIGVLAGVLALAVAAVAIAETKQTFEQKYTAAKPNKSTGTSFKTTSSEDGNAEKNHQPKATRQFNITFPAGSKVDTSAAPQCKDIDESADDPCPKNTTVGSGHAQVVLPYPGFPTIIADVTAYNRKNGLFLYVQAPGQSPVYLKPKFSGLTLKTATPPNCIASTNQNGHCVNNDGSEGVEAVLTEFDLKTKAVTKGKGKKKKTFLKTPPKCTKAGWTFKASITYDDGSKATPKSTQKCSK
jgi:hypothetical protein